MNAYDFSDFVSPAPHPGEHLREEFLPGYGLTAGGLARAMGLTDRTRIERLVGEQQAVTADTALRLARVFGTTPQFWIGLQADHDLSKAATWHARNWRPSGLRRAWARLPSGPCARRA